MRELAAVLKKAEAMAPLTALKVLGELACMDEHDELEAELRGDVEASLEKADGEIAFARDSGRYQYFVVNDVLDSTVDEIMEIVRKEIQRG